MARICFVVTPFLPEHQPALGVSTLAAALKKAGHDVEIAYLNLDFRQYAGSDVYYFVSRKVPAELLLGEMVFASALWPTVDWEAYIEAFERAYATPRFAYQIPTGTDRRAAAEQHRGEWQSIKRQLHVLHLEAPAIVGAWAARLTTAAPDILGFTSTFQQNLASLALAKAVRAGSPDGAPTIVFGGANCEAAMGASLARNFPFVDQVVSGEADLTITALVDRIVAPGSSTPGLPRYVAGDGPRELDDLPVPAFDDYFRAIAGTDLADKANLVAETSRGCWWGAKQHCTFCGLNGANMSFRSKSHARMVEEVTGLSTRHQSTRFLMADNILDLRYLDTAMRELVIRGSALQFFYETKSNLRKDQLEMMAASGIIDIQPGIESFSTPILRLMAKGTTRLQNVQLLKWAAEFHINVKWNFLYGFPGEDPREYDDMAVVIRTLQHLPAPSGCAQVRIDRFSPYWRDPGRYGITELRPSWSYRHAYPGLSDAELAELAYFFEYAPPPRLPAEYSAGCIDAINDWMAASGRGATLEIQRQDHGIRVLDSRLGTATAYPLSDLEWQVLRALDSSRRPAAARQTVAEALGVHVDEPEFLSIVERFADRGWVLEEGGNVLSVVLDRDERSRVIDRRVTIQLESLGLAPSGSTRTTPVIAGAQASPVRFVATERHQ